MTHVRAFVWLVALGIAAPGAAQAEAFAVRTSERAAWIGERVPFFVELRARGTFAGAASFELPEVASTLIVKVGNPVVSTQQLDGDEWFVQTHEFALFSQTVGTLEVPSFPARFQSRDGFTGPVAETRGQVPGFSVSLRRPPGSERIGYVITTESLRVAETWHPTPGPCEVGAVFRRTIVQTAEQQVGMALPPAPRSAPEGVRVYAGAAATADDLARGAFVGRREETLTYMVSRPGTHTLPSLTFVAWDPSTESFSAVTLPEVTLDVAAAAGPKAAAAPRAWPWLAVAAAAAAMAGLGRRRIGALAGRAARWWRSPERVAARRLRAACRRHDAAAANAAWLAWQVTQPPDRPATPALRSAVDELQRFGFAAAPTGTWCGDALARAFAATRQAPRVAASRVGASALPELNPRGSPPADPRGVRDRRGRV